MSKKLCSRFFHILLNTLLKYSNLYTFLQIIRKRLYRKFIQQNFFWKKGYLWDSCNKSIWVQKCTINKFVRILNKWQKTEKLLFFLLNNPTLNANFESSFDFNTNMRILIILKMPFLIRSTILDLMLVLVSVSYFGNLSW